MFSSLCHFTNQPKNFLTKVVHLSVCLLPSFECTSTLFIDKFIKPVNHLPLTSAFANGESLHLIGLNHDMSLMFI